MGLPQAATTNAPPYQATSTPCTANKSATSLITINASALIHNYQLLRSKVGENCEVAAVVKANAYGLGLKFVAPILERAGCEFFYVANLDEAIELRRITNKKVAVLAGCHTACGGNQVSDFIHYNLIPVLNSVDQVKNWPINQPAIWHFDTGMNRLGIEIDHAPELLLTHKKSPNPNILYCMTHFTSSEELNDSSLDQITLFDRYIPRALPHSLCNSSAIFRDPSWHRQQVRAGMALYGLNPTPWAKNPMYDVVRLSAQILQLKTAKAGETAGYNCTYNFKKDTQLAIVGYGYADGFHRKGSNLSNLYWDGVACPVRGRVSMDLIIVEMTSALFNVAGSHHNAVPRPPQVGDYLDIIIGSDSIDQLACDWKTNNYEILTSLSRRSERYIVD